MVRKDEVHVRDVKLPKRSTVGEEKPTQLRPASMAESEVAIQYAGVTICTWVNCLTHYFGRPGQYVVEAGVDELTIWGPLPDRLSCKPEPEVVESE